LGGRGKCVSEFEASLVYKVSSRTARATQRDPVSRNQKKKKKKKEEEEVEEEEKEEEEEEEEDDDDNM
jgi:ribosomal protein L12E/L44/L45/RPP1/RPP2